jgi:hypothetical protein
LRELSGFVQLDMPMFQYYINLCSDKSGWTKPFAFSRWIADQVPDFNWIRTNQNLALEQFGAAGHRITEAGWHFTYLGGPARIQNKLNAFSHTEGWHEIMREDSGTIQAHIDAGYVVGNFWHLAEYRPLDASYPRFILENQARFASLGYIRDIYEALRALQLHARAKEEDGRQQRRKLAEIQADRAKIIDALNEAVLRLGPAASPSASS